MKTRQKIIQNVDSEKLLAGGRELSLTYKLGDGDPVPAVLLLPDSAQAAPAAVLVHGYSSRKEDLSGTIGRALLSSGIASLALDLPLHGSRTGSVQLQSSWNPTQLISNWRQALRDVKLGLAYLSARSEVDRERLALLGYSMGSFLATIVAADERSVRALVIAAGGDLPQNTPFASLARAVADPMRSIKKLKGRPLLMVHGRSDRTVSPEQAQRLFDSALEPKKLIWYDSGHRLPAGAGTAVAEWLKGQL